MDDKQIVDSFKESYGRQIKTLIGTAMDMGLTDYYIIEQVRDAILKWQDEHPEYEEDDEEVD